MGASISSIRVWKPNTRDAEASRFPDMEEIQFTYQRIIWTFEDGGIQAEDDTISPGQ
jgi:type VI secretion system secreted protein Hcp